MLKKLKSQKVLKGRYWVQVLRLVVSLSKPLRPSDYTEGRVSVGVGNDNLKRGEAMLNLPITDNVIFALQVCWRNVIIV